MREVDDLRQEASHLTRQYHALLENREHEEALNFYVERLLPLELRCSGQLPPAGQQQPDVLVLLVGHSLEPLLQTILAYRPRQILLVLNQNYPVAGALVAGGTFARRHVLPYIQKLSQHNCSANVRQPFQVLAEDNPEAVFRHLNEALRQDIHERKRIVVDITGSKKSMVAGAFLFAAYTGNGVSYVDFDDYDDAGRRPLGYTCRIGLLDNPYQRFSLREWGQVRQFYAHDAFDAAAQGLQDIISSMAGYFTDEQIAAARRLHWVITWYDLWVNGNYHTAWERYEEGRPAGLEELPMLPAVAALGPTWPRAARQLGETTTLAEISRELNELLANFYTDRQRLLLYAQDESHKVIRLAHEKADHRSALIRAAGLNEVLFKSRVLWLWDNHYLTSNDARDHNWLQKKLGAWQAWHILTEAPGQERQFTFHDSGRQMRLTRAAGAPQVADEYWLPYLSPEEVRDLRNKSTHTVLPIPAGVAQSAAYSTQANLAALAKNWFGVPLPDASQPLPWEELCTLCEVDFIPPEQPQGGAQ